MIRIYFRPLRTFFLRRALLLLPDRKAEEEEKWAEDGMENSEVDIMNKDQDQRSDAGLGKKTGTGKGVRSHARGLRLAGRLSWIGGLALVYALVLTLGTLLIFGTPDRSTGHFSPGLKPLSLSAESVENKVYSDYESLFQAFRQQQEALEMEWTRQVESTTPDSAASDGSQQGLWGTIRDLISSGDTKISESSGQETADVTAPQDSAIADPGSQPLYSETNLQVEGVQEADVIRTDGTYIYAISSLNLTILEAADGQPKVKSRIMQDGGYGGAYFEMYVTKGRLIAIREMGGMDGAGTPEEDSQDVSTRTRRVEVALFDIGDPAKPVKLGVLSQSGSYNNSRMIGDMLYLISNDASHSFETMEEGKPVTFLPAFTENGREIVPDAADIVTPDGADSVHFTVVSGIDTTGRGRFVSEKSVFGRNFEVFCSKENLYLTAEGGEVERREKDGRTMKRTRTGATLVTKISLQKGQVQVKASAKVPGHIDDPFSMDEKDGVLRLVTTSYQNTDRIRLRSGLKPEDEGRLYDEFGAVIDRIEQYAEGPVSYNYGTSSGLYTLDEDLKLLGKVDNLAPDEQVYACRFLGDFGYFVTFRQVDPLFSVDLSDPKAPRVLGKLKIPGFSEYLHPWADGLLFGFGRDADPNTGRPDSLKLSMFDHGDPADVRELDTLLLEGLYESEASVNHKAILVDARQNLIAFPADGSYHIYTWDRENGFRKRAQMVLSGDRGADAGSLRGLFIGDVFYVVTPRTINCFDMKNDYKNLSSLTYDEYGGPVERKAWEPEVFQGIE